MAASGAYSDLTGAPNLSSYITNNVSGDFTVDSGTLFVDAATNRVGINLGSGVSPTVPLNVAGTVRFQSTSSAGQSVELTNYSGVSKFYRANGRLEFQAGNTGNDELILSNTGGLTFGGNDVLTSASTIDAATLDGVDSTSFLRSDANDTMTGDLTISSGSNSAPVHVYTQLEIESASHSALQFSGSTNAEQWIWFADDSSSTPVGGITYNHNTPNMGFRVEGAERARFDSLGRYIIGKTTAGLGTAGHTFDPSGYSYQTRAGDIQFLNRTGSDGVHTRYYRDGADKGNIGVYSNKLQIGQGNANVQFSNADDAIIPANGSGTLNDNAIDLGTPSARFNDIYSGGGIFATGTDYQVMVRSGSSIQPWYLRSVSDGSFRVHLNGTGDIANYTSSGVEVAGNLIIDNQSPVLEFQPDGNYSPKIDFSDGGEFSYATAVDTFYWKVGGNSGRLSLDSSGNLIAAGNVTAYSDERLKDNIETLDGSKVYEMRGVSFTKDGEAGSGVIAQELQKVARELVHEQDGYLSVAYGNVVGYLIEAIKELKAEIEELKKG